MILNWNINALFWYTFYCIFSDCVHFRMPSTFWITNPKTIMRNNVAAGSDVSENKWRRKFLPFLFINAFARTLIMGFDLAYMYYILLVCRDLVCIPGWAYRSFLRNCQNHAERRSKADSDHRVHQQCRTLEPRGQYLNTV